MADPTPIIQGDSPTFRLAVLDSGGDPLDLTDYDISFFLKRSLQDSDVAAIFEGDRDEGVVIPFAETDGILDVTVPKTATVQLCVGRPYYWYLQLTDSFDDTVVLTPQRGTFLVTLPNAVLHV